MAAIGFYHLTATPLERALPKLLEKAYGAGFTILVLAEEKRIDPLNQLLWSYDPNSFLPHGSDKEGHADTQPILLSAQETPTNHARLLAVVDGQRAQHPESFDRILDIFDGKDPQAVENARLRWSAYKEASHELTYLRQTEQGGWEQKF